MADNEVGIVGVAPDSRLLALKACWHTAEAARERSATALRWPRRSKRPSWRMRCRQPESRRARGSPAQRLIQHGLDRGILFVGAVAPPGCRRLSGRIPRRARGRLAEDEAGNTGICSRPAMNSDAGTRRSLGFASGSSLAAAEVSGTLALLLAQQPHLSAPETSAYSRVPRTKSRRRPERSVHRCLRGARSSFCVTDLLGSTELCRRRRQPSSVVR